MPTSAIGVTGLRLRSALRSIYFDNVQAEIEANLRWPYGLSWNGGGGVSVVKASDAPGNSASEPGAG
jgi:hypothetical protein